MDLKLMFRDWGIEHPVTMMTIKHNNKSDLKSLEDLDFMFQGFGTPSEIYKHLNQEFTPIGESMITFLFNNKNSAYLLKQIILKYVGEQNAN